MGVPSTSVASLLMIRTGGRWGPIRGAIHSHISNAQERDVGHPDFVLLQGDWNPRMNACTAARTAPAGKAQA